MLLLVLGLGPVLKDSLNTGQVLGPGLGLEGQVLVNIIGYCCFCTLWANR